MNTGDGLTCLLRLVVWGTLLVILGGMGYLFWFLMNL